MSGAGGGQQVAVAASIPLRAGADVVTDPVMAGAPVGTGVGCTVVGVDLTALTREAGTAAAHADTSLNNTRTTIGTWQGCAFVHPLLTVEACVTFGAVTRVATAIVLFMALATLEAWHICTGKQAVFTVRSLKVRQAGAHVAIIQLRTVAFVPAGVAVTLPHLQLTVDPSVPWHTCAGVAALARVHACGSILTRLVVGAEVQILVTEESTPAFLAVALPRLVASAMLTYWVLLTLSTEGALPALSADTLSRLGAIAVGLAAPLKADRFFAVFPLPARETG